jgi:hypothetical protein
MIKQMWTDADLDNCIFFQSVVEVSFGGELADNGLVQRTIRMNQLKSNGWHYLCCKQ